MQKTRVISSLVGLVILLLITFSGKTVFGIASFIVALIGLYELYNTFNKKGLNPVRGIGYISALPILFLALVTRVAAIGKYITLFKLSTYFSFGIFVIMFVLFMAIIFRKDKYNFIDISVTAFGALYVSFLFSFLVLTRNTPNGQFLIWFIFFGAWSTDIFAYLVGRKFGKHKLIPTVSPNKTVEGAVGGALGSILATIAFGLLINPYIKGMQFNFTDLLILGIFNGIFAQLGDLSGSIIKRFAEVKDFGSIMPGHGGVLDRFDSIMFIGPVVYFYITLIILA